MTDEELGRAESKRTIYRVDMDDFGKFRIECSSDGGSTWSVLTGEMPHEQAKNVCGLLARQAATIAELEKELKDWKDGANAEAFCHDEARSEIAELRQRAEKAEAERDELLASHQKVVGEHNGLVLTGDSLLAKAGQYRVERDAALAKCRELEETLQSLQTK